MFARFVCFVRANPFPVFFVSGKFKLSEYDSLVEQLFKWFLIPYNPSVKQHFVPEARIEKVQNRMFSSPYVEVRILPVFFRLF